MNRAAPLSRALTAIAAVALLAGCSGAAARSTDDPPRPSASLTPYVPPTLAPEPVPVTTLERDEAVDAVLRFFDALNYGFAHGDADPLRRVSTLGCSGCVGWVQEIQRMADAGQHQRGGWVRVVGMTATGASGDQFAFRASLLREPGEVVEGATAVPVSAAGKGELVDVVVAPRTSGVSGTTVWTLVAMELAPMGEVTPGPSAS